jgi:hypothetical protein
VYGFDRLDRLDFDDDGVFHDQVDAKVSFKFKPLVPDRKTNLRRVGDSSTAQFFPKRRDVAPLQKPRAEFPMHFDGRPDHPAGDGISSVITHTHRMTADRNPLRTCRQSSTKQIFHCFSVALCGSLCLRGEPLSDKGSANDP